MGGRSKMSRDSPRFLQSIEDRFKEPENAKQTARTRLLLPPQVGTKLNNLSVDFNEGGSCEAKLVHYFHRLDGEETSGNRWAEEYAVLDDPAHEVGELSRDHLQTERKIAPGTVSEPEF
ncbi:hypothetical protein BD410DRAFT_807398 [Rickenella mellea]|uniref:Uncharacterized protein n=1 Tax=Rickenella mellea TaxID=50990 RepID=A0A4Y7PQ87_9AGAM|nr:hypothetical protein BD410DRAFT_807398 [Rickenella mellea]